VALLLLAPGWARAEPELPPALRGPAYAAEYVAADDAPLFDPLEMEAGPLHPEGALLHPAWLRAGAANIWLVERHRLSYGRLYARCLLAPARVAEAVPDPVTQRCPDCSEGEALAWRGRLLWGGGGLAVGIVAGVAWALKARWGGG